MGTISGTCTKKNFHFGKKVLASGGSYTRRERGFVRGASAAHWTSAHAPPACRSVLPHAPWATSGPSSYKSSSHNLLVQLCVHSTKYRISRATTVLNLVRTKFSSRYRTRTLALVHLLIHAPGSAHVHLFKF